MLVLAPPAALAVSEHPGPWYWSQRKLERTLDGKRFRVGRTVVPIRADTLTCGGQGRSILRAGVYRWKHFRCIQTTFPRGALVGPDALFLVHVLGRTRFEITDAHFARY